METFPANSFFDVFVTIPLGTVDVLPGGLVPAGSYPLTGLGHLHGSTPDAPNSGTRTFTTEMVSLDLTAVGPPVMLRESPTLQSLGQTAITDQGGGLFQISSFFDVFVELSLDNGQTWLPENASPYRLSNVPEPAAWGSLGALAACALFQWRRHARRA